MGRLEVLCIGSGDALASTVSHDVGASSTSFVITLDEHPVVLIGVGPGTLRALLHYTSGRVPSTVVVLSSSLEQCGDLPLLVAHQQSVAGRSPHIFAACPEDQPKVQQLLELMVGSDCPTVHNVRSESSGERTALAVPTYATKGGDQKAMSVSSVGQLLGVHERGEFSASTIDANLMVRYRDQPALAIISPQTAFPTNAAMLTLASFPVMLAFCSRRESPGRLPMGQLMDFIRSRLVVGHSGFGPEGRATFAVVGWGHPSETPRVVSLAGKGGEDMVAPSASISVMGQGSSLVLMAGDFVTSPFSYLSGAPRAESAAPPSEAGLFSPLSLDRPPLPNVRSTHSASGTTSPVLNTTSRSGSFVFVPPPTMQRQRIASNDSFSSQRSATSNTANSVDIRKVMVFDFDNKAAPGRQFLLRQYRRLDQLESAISAQMNIKPLKAVLRAQTGERVIGLDGLETGDQLVAVRHGGGRFGLEELPRALAQKMKL